MALAVQKVETYVFLLFVLFYQFRFEDSCKGMTLAFQSVKTPHSLKCFFLYQFSYQDLRQGLKGCLWSDTGQSNDQWRVVNLPNLQTPEVCSIHIFPVF